MPSNTIPLPEPVTLYHRPSFLAGEYIYITGHTPDQMREYAAAVSAERDAEIAGLRKRNASQSVHIISQSDRIKVLEDALRNITVIEDEMYGPDWEEIERARCIARAALGDKT